MTAEQNPEGRTPEEIKELFLKATEGIDTRYHPGRGLAILLGLTNSTRELGGSLLLTGAAFTIGLAFGGLLNPEALHKTPWVVISIPIGMTFAGGLMAAFGSEKSLVSVDDQNYRIINKALEEIGNLQRGQSPTPK